jgi:hypothetical protein
MRCNSAEPESAMAKSLSDLSTSLSSVRASGITRGRTVGGGCESKTAALAPSHNY